MTNTQLEKKAAALIEALWNDISNVDGECEECPHFACQRQHHPYGSTTAAETLCECTVGDAKDCPHVAELLRVAVYATAHNAQASAEATAEGSQPMPHPGGTLFMTDGQFLVVAVCLVIALLTIGNALLELLLPAVRRFYE